MGDVFSKKEEKSPTRNPTQGARNTNLHMNKALSKSTPDLFEEQKPRRRKFVKIGNIKVSIIQGKIAEENADVIVNSVNSDLDLETGRGSKALSESGGDAIQKECQENYPGGITENEVAVTNGGNLKCRKVYHVTLPKWEDNNKQAITTAMTNCLTMADQYNTMLQSVVDFEQLFHSTSIESIVIVCHRTQNSVFRAFERKTRELSGAVSQGGSHSCKCGNINVIIQKGTITKQRCDVMVITASKDLKLKYGMLSKSVLDAAGPDIQTACDNNYPSGVDYTEVAATRAYKLHCRFVYFGSLPDWKNTSDNPQQVLTDFITNCLEKAHSHDTKYIAFPTVGTGALKYPPDVMAKTMESCIRKFDLKHSDTKLQHIYIVVFDKSKDCMVVENALLKEFQVTRGLTLKMPSAPPPSVEPSAPPESPAPGTPAFFLWMYNYQDKPPSYWSIFGPAKSLKEWNSQTKRERYKLVKVTRQIETAVRKIVEETWIPKYVGKGRDGAGLEDLNYTKIQVTKVERIENTELFEKYVQMRGKLFHKAGVLETTFDQLGDLPSGVKKRKVFTTVKADKSVFTDVYPEINEHYLFHGTQEDRIPTIATQGFDIRLTDKAMFGAAVYASESSTKADQYAGIM
ncbi:unnamed protein product [Mytilus coruscus]|uniref:Poly [ADP-ribose] polymerase n=1 Tax=Mytilus coruscus TaxID=42192 RepID=A0A6J8DWK5_MYTCO|nr:unnamed protein product [Mytilus coruscus]